MLLYRRILFFNPLFVYHIQWISIFSLEIILESMMCSQFYLIALSYVFGGAGGKVALYNSFSHIVFMFLRCFWSWYSLLVIPQPIPHSYLATSVFPLKSVFPAPWSFLCYVRTVIFGFSEAPLPGGGREWLILFMSLRAYVHSITIHGYIFQARVVMYF